MVKTDQQMYDEIVMPIYRQMYKEATPSADIDELIKNGTAKEKGFFDKYYLPQKRQTEIIEAELKRHKIRNHDKNRIWTEVTLGSAPTGVHPSERKIRIM